ncbi:MAG: DUF393 domain-containing protein [Acidobacteriia bacterium]|nr:DUF393 domain-containing protein [Terriglobia bacterium]
MGRSLRSLAPLLDLRVWSWIVWASLLLHLVLPEFAPRAVLPYFYALQIVLVVVPLWPRRLVVIYDGACGICNRARRLWQRFDFLRAFQWDTFQSGAGEQWSISKEALEEKLHLVSDGAISSGFRACKNMLLCHPATYVVLAAMLAVPPGHLRRVLLALPLAFFFPFLEPVGEAAYAWVARNRYRFSSEGACATDAKQ